MDENRNKKQNKSTDNDGTTTICENCARPITGRVCYTADDVCLCERCIMALARSEQQAEQKTLPACEGCGLEPEQAPVNSQAIGQFYWCPFCQDNLPGEFSRDAWTTRQFRRRHEAIDRLTIAIVQGTSIAPVLIGGIGALMGTRQPDSAAEAAVRKSYEAAPKVAAEIHKINLAQRRAEALKIMEGRGCC